MDEQLAIDDIDIPCDESTSAYTAPLAVPSVADTVMLSPSHSPVTNRSQHLDVHRYAAGAALAHVVEVLAGEIESHEERTRQRTGAEAQRLRVGISVLVLNLQAVHSILPVTQLAIPLGRSAYSCEARYNNTFLTYRQFRAAYDGLVALGYIRVTSEGLKSLVPGKSHVTLVVPTAKMISAISQVGGLTPMDLAPSPTRETLILRDELGTIIDYAETEETYRMRSNLAYINAAASAHWPDLAISDAIWTEMQGRLVKTRGKEAVDLGKRFVYRVFNNSRFDHGGRIYGGWWQLIPRELRPYIRINGELTAEVDYSGMHARMLLAMEGLPVPDDPYNIGFPPIHRAAVKKTFNAMLNANNPRINAVPEFDKKAIGMSWKDFMAAIRSAYPGLQKYFYSGIGVSMMRKDSDILERVLLHFARKAIPCLPIHDSVVISHRYVQELKEVMEQEFHAVVGVPGKVKMTMGVLQADFPDDGKPIVIEQGLSPLYKGPYAGYQARLYQWVTR